MKDIYIPTDIKREVVRFDLDCKQKGKIVKTDGGEIVAIHYITQTT